MAAKRSKRRARNARPDRMPPIPRARQTLAQRAAVAEISAGPRGGLIGPFIPALRSPELMRRLQHLGEYLRYDNELGAKLTELAIVLTARAWSQQFEWALHSKLAAEHGVSRAAIEAIAAGRRPRSLGVKEAIVYDVFTELERTQGVSDETYARAVAALGEAGVIDLLGVIGYYSLLAIILNVARTPLPPGEKPGLQPFPASRG